ncbi:hypothetical protein FRB90_001786 [Tulasnella sp. 427]|nr:hypothetical protein FRB90_001786 [Tulasnella sp. 427]
MSDTENDADHDSKRRRLDASSSALHHRYETGVAGPSTTARDTTNSPERNNVAFVPESMDVWLEQENSQPGQASPSSSNLYPDRASPPISLEAWIDEEDAREKGKTKAPTPPDEEIFDLPAPGPSGSLPHMSQLIVDSQAADTTVIPKEPTPPTPRRRSPTPQPASEFTCPICFCPPTAAVLTPCGHIMCGSCLFSAIETAAQRARMNGYGGEALEARCPVCRAKLENWDGRGNGVIGLELKVAMNVS